MIKFYYNLAPNPMKVALFLEEADLPYEPVPIDTRKGEQHSAAFLAFNPNAKLPVITDGDVRRYLERNSSATMQGALHDTCVGEIMTKGSVTLSPKMIAGEAQAILQSKRIQAAFVVTDNRPVGLVTMLRLLNRGAA